MPCWIDTGRDGAVGLEVDFLRFAVVYYHGSAAELAHVEEHVVGAVVLERMAVDALSLLLGVNHAVVVDVAFLIAGDVALNDGDTLVCYV